MSNAMQAVGRNLSVAAVPLFLMFPLATQAHLRLACPLQGQPPQQEKSGTTILEAAPAKTDAQADKGYVDGHTYKNGFRGVEFTAPQDLEFKEPGITSEPGTSRHTISIQACSKPHNRFAPRKYIVDTGIMFVADSLDGYPEDQRTNDGYMRRMSQLEEHEGFKGIEGKLVDRIGETAFTRANFAQGKRHHIVLVAMGKDYAFVFIFVANDMEAANTLIRSTSLKLPQ